MSDWMDTAWGELGVEEVAGPGNNPRIQEYHAACGVEESPDSVAWCSSYVNWCMMKCGRPRTKSRAARSWVKWGVGLTDPIPGCVVVLWRVAPDAWQGHVGLFVGDLGDHILMLGGNQSNEVCVRRYPKVRVLQYRWPSV